MKLAYVDACVWIALVEGADAYRKVLRTALATLSTDGWELCTSDAVLLEVLIRPMRNRNRGLSDSYRTLLGKTRWLTIPPTVFSDALTVSAREGLKAMDAVHCTIAMHHGCRRFVTTDPHFKSLQVISPEWISLGNAIATEP